MRPLIANRPHSHRIRDFFSYNLTNSCIAEVTTSHNTKFVVIPTELASHSKFTNIIKGFSKIKRVFLKSVLKLFWKKLHYIQVRSNPSTISSVKSLKRSSTMRFKASLIPFSVNKKLSKESNLQKKILKIRRGKLEVMQRNLINAAKVNNYRYIDKTANRLSKEEINGTDQHHNTAIYYASMLSKINAVSSLLSHGANPNSINESGNTPLHQAFRANNVQCVSALLAFGADPKIENYFNQTPIFFASKKMIQDLGLSKWACISVQNGDLDSAIRRKTIAEPKDYKLDSLEQSQSINCTRKRVMYGIKSKQFNSLRDANRDKKVDIPLYINNLLRKADIDLFKVKPKF